MDGKQQLAQQHFKLVEQLKYLSSMLHEQASGVDDSLVLRLDCRIRQLEQIAVDEIEWHSPFSSEQTGTQEASKDKQ